MKQKVLLLLLALNLGLAGCATTGEDSQPKPSAAKPSEKDPENGMTKAQVLERYGKTDNIQSSSEGETWIYNLNMGEMFIPFNFGYRPKMRIITFDANGLVKSWSYSK
jgi:hypothetical protein